MKDIENEDPIEVYSLRGQGEELTQRAGDLVYLLGLLCLMGQATVFYAKYNIGKTLILIYLILEAIFEGRIKAKDVIYINADDDERGLAAKVTIFEQVGAHMLAPGYRGFQNSLLVEIIKKLILLDLCAGKLIVLDTLKKFTDLMDKKASRIFNDVIRQFVLKGGTVVALAHTNKKPDAQGRPIPEGTGDVLNDFDCGYVIDDSGPIEDGLKTVRFKREKNRGKSVEEALYAYDPDPDLDYEVRLNSVTEIDPTDVRYFPEPVIGKDDEAIIDAIENAIRFDPGGRGKMDIVSIVCSVRNVTRRGALTVLEHYTGDDPKLHRWTFKRLERGRMQYSLLDCPEDGPAEASG